MLLLQTAEESIVETDNMANTTICISLQNSEGLERDIPLYIFTSNGTAGTHYRLFVSLLLFSLTVLKVTGQV